ncbi:MAG: phage holin family protein [Dehalococcoidia bacterium]
MERVSPFGVFGQYLAGMMTHIREAGLLRVGIRALIIWAIDTVAIIVMVAILPGFDADSLGAAIMAALVIGLLNALVRPLILALAVNLPIIFFGVLIFFLNAAVILLAGRLVPGFEVSGLLVALVASFGLTAINTALTALLHINDDDSFYRNVVQKLQTRQGLLVEPERPGTVIVQIDGLAEPIFRRALAEGRMPTLDGWLKSGSHRLVGWDCDVPSMTSSGQAGILWGNNANIPAFRWYDKELGRLLVSNRPADARLINERQSSTNGLLQTGGSSINNIFTGGAERSVMTMATIVDENGKVTAAPQDFAGFFASPYNLTRLLMSSVWEVAKEYYQAWQQRRRKVQPHMHRGGKFPLQRLGTNVLLRDLTLWLVVADMQRGRFVSYCDLLGYDEVAHHAGPTYIDSMRTLREIDMQVHALEKAAAASPRRYQFVVLSDHGQSWGATFLQRYGITLEQLVRGLLQSSETVHQTSEGGEGAGYVSAALSQMSASGGMVGGGVRRVMRTGADGTSVEIGRDAEDQAAAAAADIIVSGSGNLGLISFTTQPGRLSREFFDEHYPALIDGLVAHEGVGWLLVRSERLGSLVIGKGGIRYLDDGRVEGDDPLAAFAPSTTGFLQRLSSYPNVPDIVVNSTLYDASTGEVAAFEELIGCHGGAGGMQNEPFLLFPSDWTNDDPTLIGSESVHAFLLKHIHGAG